MGDMKKKAEDILEDYANFYSQVDLEALAKFLEQIKSEAIKEIIDGLVTMFLNINESLSCEDIVENIKRFSNGMTEGRENV